MVIEYRHRCRKCKWDGLDSDIKEHKLLSGKPFPVCPSCKQHREQVICGHLRYNRSVLTGYCSNVPKPITES